jgi:hypothetical protein
MEYETRGKIQFRDRAKQIIDFSGIRYQQITPTDIDGLIEYRDTAFLVYEYKLEGAKMPYGQELALTRLVDSLQKSGKIAALLLCKHDVRDPNDDINGADAKVIKIYYCKNWYSDMKRRTVKEVTNSFIEFVNKQTPF